jgi:hypothetical protein
VAEVKVEVDFATDGQSASSSWCWTPLRGVHDQILSFLWQEDRSVVCSAITAQSRAGPITILYCLFWDSPNLEDTGFPFRRPLWLAGLRCRYSSLPLHGKLPHLSMGECEVKLWPTVSRPVYLGVGFTSGAHDQSFIPYLTIASFLTWGALSDDWMGLQYTFTIASGPCQSSHSQVQVPQNLLPHLKLPGRQGPHIHIPREWGGGGPVIPFCCSVIVAEETCLIAEPLLSNNFYTVKWCGESVGSDLDMGTVI